MLGIWGGKGHGKTFQLKPAFKKLDALLSGWCVVVRVFTSKPNPLLWHLNSPLFVLLSRSLFNFPPNQTPFCAAFASRAWERESVCVSQ
jgi:hypothetical protein